MECASKHRVVKSSSLFFARRRSRGETLTEEEADVVSFLVSSFPPVGASFRSFLGRATSRNNSVLFNPVVPSLVVVICVGIEEKKERERRRRKRQTPGKRGRESALGSQMSNQAVILLRNQLRGERNGGVCALLWPRPKSCFFVHDDDDVNRTRTTTTRKIFFSLTASRTGVSFFLFAKKPRADDAVLFSTTA